MGSCMSRSLTRIGEHASTNHVSIHGIPGKYESSSTPINSSSDCIRALVHHRAIIECMVSPESVNKRVHDRWRQKQRQDMHTTFTKATTASPATTHDASRVGLHTPATSTLMFAARSCPGSWVAWGMLNTFHDRSAACHHFQHAAMHADHKDHQTAITMHARLMAGVWARQSAWGPCLSTIRWWPWWSLWPGLPQCAGLSACLGMPSSRDSEGPAKSVACMYAHLTHQHR